MAAVIVMLISLMLVWLWLTSRIGAFTVGTLYGCASLASFLFVAWCDCEFNSHDKKYEREMQRLPKA
jgi:hypothetical protein